MNISNRTNQTRSIIAIVLIAASFLSALILSKAANQTQLMWGARSSLLPGKVIREGDLFLRKVAMPEGAANYFLRGEKVANYGIVREVKAGELIPRSAVTADLTSLKWSEVPISVQSSDSPVGIAVGQFVNIYHVNDLHNPESSGPPKLVLIHVSILGVDTKSQNLGGALSLTLAVDSRLVKSLLAATEFGRLVLVRVNA